MSSANDLKAAKATYDSFIGLIKVAVPIIAIITIVVVKLISS
jgi:tRNA threonylcarbamoyladenosine modification (KEOPS) complex  Pcc1 subunit